MPMQTRNMHKCGSVENVSVKEVMVDDVNKQQSVEPLVNEPVLDINLLLSTGVISYNEIADGNLTGELQRFTCTICNCSFSRKQQVRYHDYCVTGKRPLKCDLCGKGFVKKSHLVYHIRTHTGESPFKCSICQKRFKQKAKLNRHEKTHETETRMLCIYCKKFYSDKDSLRKHEQKHSEKVYNCTTCKKSYKAQFSLTEHLAIHKSPNYICDVCGKSFLKKNRLNVHKRIHEDIYPFECDKCHRTFRSQKELTHHRIVHDKNNPGHECEICNITCGRRDNLLRHIRNCHLDPCQKKSQKESNDNSGGQQTSPPDLDKSNHEEPLHLSTNIDQTSEEKVQETENKKNNTISSKANNAKSSSKLIVKLFPCKNDTNNPVKLQKKLNNTNESKKTNVKKKLKNNTKFPSVNREKSSIKESVVKTILVPEERIGSVEGNQPIEACNISFREFQTKASKGLVKSKEESNSPLPSERDETNKFEENNLPLSTGSVLSNRVPNGRTPSNSSNGRGVTQKTSVIMHTDLYKASILAANSLRDPVIKSSKLPIVSIIPPQYKSNSEAPT